MTSCPRWRQSWLDWSESILSWQVTSSHLPVNLSRNPVLRGGCQRLDHPAGRHTCSGGGPWFTRLCGNDERLMCRGFSGLMRPLSKRASQKALKRRGTTKNTSKSFSFPLWPSCSSWFKAFMLFATPPRSRNRFIETYCCMSHNDNGLGAAFPIGLAGIFRWKIRRKQNAQTFCSLRCQWHWSKVVERL